MNARRIFWRLMKNAEGPCEIQIRICRTQHSYGHRAIIRRRQNRGSFGARSGGSVAAIAQKSQLPVRGVLNTRHTRNFDVGIAFKYAAKPFGKLAEFHRILLEVRRSIYISLEECEAGGRCVPQQKPGAAKLF